MPLNRRSFLKYGAIAPAGVLLPETALAVRVAGDSTFTLWQLPLQQTPSQGNSYVFRSKHGKVIVVDGGMPGEAGYLRGFLGALGNKVEAWFLSHPHNDHVGAISEILKAPQGICIKTIYHSKLSASLYKDDPVVAGLYKNLETYRLPSPAVPRHDVLSEDLESTNDSPAEVIDVRPGLAGEIDGVHFKILSAKNEEITSNQYNNSSMIVRMWDATRSVVFLGDTGEEEGEKVLNGQFRRDLDCDFLQLAHHGQQGVDKKFYQSIKFNACLWSTPRWLWDNDAGRGFNTGPWKTLETRQWMKELGIEKHFFAADGLQIIQ
ncbi:ComEC/Rec2 family competence protein [Silvibacterium acidisoli]|uniref:ComEC/Rec2 family competence protein n=1 Tax=Acidobacteriaceae bacterium ZG23-2 TaxID=2883246 RepID=UPI00406D34B1